MKNSYYIFNTKLIYPNLDYRFYVCPHQRIPVQILGLLPFGTDPKLLKKTYDMGYNDALE